MEWHELSDEIARATFTHPLGGSITMQWDKSRAERAGLIGRQTWKQYPRAMLRARLVNEAISSVFPGVCVGIYTPEEVEDFDAKPPIDVPSRVISESENERPEEKKSPISEDDSEVAILDRAMSGDASALDAVLPPQDLGVPLEGEDLTDYRANLEQEWMEREWSSQRRAGQVKRLTRGEMSWGDLMCDPCPYPLPWVRALYDKAILEFSNHESNDQSVAVAVVDESKLF